MKVKAVRGTNFKNYDDINLEFSDICNIIYGSNGSGKTNFLDLIHVSALGKSYFSITDKQAIKNNHDFFRIEVKFLTDQDETITSAVSIPKVGKKKIWLNGNLLKRNSEILGSIPIVCVVPDDIDIIRGSSIVRRKFINRILCQIDPSYTESLLSYDQILKQKLSLLKNGKSVLELDQSLLDTYDQLLYNHATIIHAKRGEFCTDFLPHFTKIHSDITDQKETAQIVYQSNFSPDTFLADSKSNRDLDFYTKRVRKGVHRDDINLLIDEIDVRKFASQGQKKTFIYALKFSEYLYLANQSKKRPLMLLDDIFEKLDQERLKHLFEVLTSSNFGQIFITDTERNRSSDILKELNINFQTFKVQDNTITPFNG